MKNIDYYSSVEAGWFSKLTDSVDWGNRLLGEQYLDKYWLPQSEYEEVWLKIQQKLFVSEVHSLPELIFSDTLELLITLGGCLFIEGDFRKLQKCMLEIGEEYFIVIENDFNGTLTEPSFKLKFPTNISWEEFTSGNFASSTFIESMYKEFFVFGDSGTWGRYSASDYEFPLDILGYEDQYSAIFNAQFTQSKEEIQKLIPFIPKEYKILMNKNK